MAVIRFGVAPSGERTNPEGKSIRNKVLLGASDDEFRLIRPHLQFVDLPDHLVLHQSHRSVKFAYFPNKGLISLVVEMENGKTVEAGLLGNDGASGMSAVLGLTRSPLREIVQVSGNGSRVKVETLRELLPSTPGLQLILSRYAAGLAMQVAQTAACNRLHKVQERLARWLLIAQDRLDSATVPITQDFLATMLGTDRPSVSLAAGILQRQGVIATKRGAPEILNRKKLEQCACECYAVVRQYNSSY